jgi:DNA-directed RNA polymerase subunit B
MRHLAPMSVLIASLNGDTGRFAKVVVPYAFKLLLQELIALGIYPKLEFAEILE